MNHSETSYLRLKDFALLQLAGPDAVKFLQGQVTCDVAQLSNESWQHGAHCTAKGRMIANFDVIKRDEQTLWLRVPADNLDGLKQSLGKYIVFSKAKLTDLSEQKNSIGIYGSDTLSWAKDNLGITFNNDQNIYSDEQKIALKLDEQRLEIWQNIDTENPATSLLTEGDQTLWLLAEIESGKGWIGARTQDTLLPQDLNLQAEAIDGINFKKGCYTGQEIVARMHYKGKLKRHLYRFTTESAQDIQPGADLFSGEKTQSKGTVVNSVKLDDRCELLAVATETDSDSGELHLGDIESGKLQLASLPYAIT